MKNIDMSGVEEQMEFKKLVAGGYICKITKVTDVPLNEATGKGDYLNIEYDIASGDFKGHFTDLFDSKGFWGGNFIRSYKETALSFFKSFTTAVEKSNKGYTFDNNEQKLVGKFIGLVLGEEEYPANDGTTKTRLQVRETRSVESIKANDFTIPEIKRVAGGSKSAVNNDSQGFMNVPIDGCEELPFK